MGAIIGIANQKGGVGKTTTAINLASSLAIAEKKTLLIDIDPQGNSTSGVGIDKNDNMDKSIYEVLLGDASIDEGIKDTEIVATQDLHPVISHVGHLADEADFIPGECRRVNEQVQTVSDIHLGPPFSMSSPRSHRPRGDCPRPTRANR